jgi:hypothetical protein
MNAGCIPERVVEAHLTDRVTDFGASSWVAQDGVIATASKCESHCDAI